MNRAIRYLALLAVGLCVATFAARAQAPGVPERQDVELSPELLALLRAEMQQIAAGVQGVALSLATGDWKTIQTTSGAMQASYIMQKELTAAQARELQTALPEGFKERDAAFHRRAERLGEAAAAHDAELVAFHYGRLVEGCADCHALYARTRFPGFEAAQQHGHGHDTPEE